MLRLSISRLGRALQGQVGNNAVVNSRVSSRFMSASTESDAEFDARFRTIGVVSTTLFHPFRYIAYFDRADIDGWEIRKVGAPNKS